MSKVIWIFFGLALTVFCDWFKKLAPPSEFSTNQMQKQIKAIVTYWLCFLVIVGTLQAAILESLYVMPKIFGVEIGFTPTSGVFHKAFFSL